MSGYLGSLSPHNIFSIFFSFLFKSIQTSKVHNDLISYVPYWGLVEKTDSVGKQ